MLTTAGRSNFEAKFPVESNIWHSHVIVQNRMLLSSGDQAMRERGIPRSFPHIRFPAAAQSLLSFEDDLRAKSTYQHFTTKHCYALTTGGQLSSNCACFDFSTHHQLHPQSLLHPHRLCKSYLHSRSISCPEQHSYSWSTRYRG